MDDGKNDNERRKVVLVTGCAKGGIGFEYCRCFHEAGCHVFASDVARNLPLMKDLEDLGVSTLELDVTSEASVAAGVAHVAARAGGRVDVLVNNAGVGATGPLAELAVADMARTLDVNVLGAVRVIQGVVPAMARGGGGTIVNVASVVAWAPTPWAGAYCASKAALQALSDALRVELRPFNINVVLVSPGAIRSNLGATNLSSLSGKQWSLYAPFTNSILERANASQSSSATPASLLAYRVVSVVLSPNPPPRFMFGHMALLFLVLSWSPIWLRDLFMSTRFGLSTSIKSKKKKT